MNIFLFWNLQVFVARKPIAFAVGDLQNPYQQFRYEFISIFHLVVDISCGVPGMM